MNGSGTKNENAQTDYSIYKPGIRWIFITAAEGFGIGCLICWLAYNDMRSLPLAAVMAILFLKLKKKTEIVKRKRELLYHFRDFVESLHTALRAGYSPENGVASAAKDLEMLYGEKDMLVTELKRITAQLRLRIRVEDLFADLGERSDLEDVQLFASLLAICRKTGGNMSRILLQTSDILCDKIDTKQEIDSQLASRAFEQKIMSIMPACIILYMRVSFHGFIETLYGNALGVFVMTACLGLYAAAFFWGRKIVNIELF